MLDHPVSIEIKEHAVREISKTKPISEYVNYYRRLRANPINELPRTVGTHTRIAITPILVRITTPTATTRQA
jgi:hypothetical protein